MPCHYNTHFTVCQATFRSVYQRYRQTKFASCDTVPHLVRCVKFAHPLYFSHPPYYDKMLFRSISYHISLNASNIERCIHSCQLAATYTPLTDKIKPQHCNISSQKCQALHKAYFIHLLQFYVSSEMFRYTPHYTTGLATCQISTFSRFLTQPTFK